MLSPDAQTIHDVVNTYISYDDVLRIDSVTNKYLQPIPAEIPPTLFNVPFWENTFTDLLQSTSSPTLPGTQPILLPSSGTWIFQCELLIMPSEGGYATTDLELRLYQIKVNAVTGQQTVTQPTRIITTPLTNSVEDGVLGQVVTYLLTNIDSSTSVSLGYWASGEDAGKNAGINLTVSQAVFIQYYPTQPTGTFPVWDFQSIALTTPPIPMVPEPIWNVVTTEPFNESTLATCFWYSVTWNSEWNSQSNKPLQFAIGFSGTNSLIDGTDFLLTDLQGNRLPLLSTDTGTGTTLYVYQDWTSGDYPLTQASWTTRLVTLNPAQLESMLTVNYYILY